LDFLLLELLRFYEDGNRVLSPLLVDDVSHSQVESL
jgi:hypothetical protein